jgi:Ni,Fe-hydrogenase III large subunit
MSRFEGTGTLSRETALALGMVGPAARASGVDRDVRRDFPTGVYRFRPVEVATAESGDVFARAQVRWLEIERSAALLGELLGGLPDEPPAPAVGPLAPDHLCVSLVEAWRGEVCHALVTDGRGRFAGYRAIDPSFRNWSGLALALRGGAISDFPLCNKSFNLSYCGFDL